MLNSLYRSACPFRRFSLQILAGVFLLGGWLPVAKGFSLLGPKTEWMTPELRYTDVGGPMARDEEYRWNVPVLTYGFDASFRERFGTNGMQAVDSAFAVLNALPAMDTISDEGLTNGFPLVSSELNPIAAAQEMQDLKSMVLGLVLKHLGLAAPETWVWSIRSAFVINSMTNRNWLLRNYDPVSGQPTNGVNGTAYSYMESPFGPAVVPFLSTTVAAGTQAAWSQNIGHSFSGLTADDVGGLRFLYRSANYNVETLPPEVQGLAGAPFVNLALRPGANHIQFVPHLTNESTGAFESMTLAFTDRYVTNGMMRQQALERVIDRPDFLFSAPSLPGLYSVTGTAGWTNLGVLNNPPNVSQAPAGPGVIQGQVRIGISDLGPNVVGGEVQYLRWAGFSGSTIDWNSLEDEVPAPVEGKVPLDIPLYNPSGAPALLRLLITAHDRDRLELQTSGDLSTWTREAVVTNVNRPITWPGLIGGTNLFFRVVAPQP
jgi:hypothetical protein